MVLGAVGFAHAGIGADHIDDVPEAVVELLHPDGAGAVRAGAVQEEAHVAGAFHEFAHHQLVAVRIHAVIVFGRSAFGETAEDMLILGVAHTLGEEGEVRAALPALLFVHHKAEHLGAFGTGAGIHVAEHGIEEHLGRAVGALAGALAAVAEFRVVGGQAAVVGLVGRAGGGGRRGHPAHRVEVGRHTGREREGYDGRGKELEQFLHMYPSVVEFYQEGRPQRAAGLDWKKWKR